MLTDNLLRQGPDIDVAIVGGGPAGLAAACALKQAGLARVVVLEREAEAGGIPRHCGHPPFGMREFKRVLRGPDYARKLVDHSRRAGVEIHCQTTVVRLRPQGLVEITTPQGPDKLSARRVVLATGVRETPRSARLISGVRAQGILNTGALQSMVYLKNRRPFHRPVIIGTELVAFSAIMTCRHAGIHPLAMIEPGPRTTARWPAGLFARMTGTTLLTNTRLISIEGEARVTAVQIQTRSGQTRSLACDGVIVSGQFTPEAALARCGHLEIDPATGGPCVDQWGRCSDPVYFAAGNLLRPVETAGWSWNEGRQAGRWVALDLAGMLPGPKPRWRITAAGPLLKYAMPQLFVPLQGGMGGMENLQLRVTRPVNGDLRVVCGETTVWQRHLRARPERRILLPLHKIIPAGQGGQLALTLR